MNDEREKLFGTEHINVCGMTMQAFASTLSLNHKMRNVSFSSIISGCMDMCERSRCTDM